MSRGKGRDRWHCKPCGKTSFGSAGRARETIERIQDGAVSTYVPVRTYSCPFGNGHHVTSQEER